MRKETRKLRFFNEKINYFLLLKSNILITITKIKKIQKPLENKWLNISPHVQTKLQTKENNNFYIFDYRHDRIFM